MKLLFGSIEDFIQELKQRKISEARVMPKVKTESGSNFPIPIYTVKVVVTARLPETSFSETNNVIAECSVYVGRDFQDFTTKRVPKHLVKRQEKILSEVKEELEQANITVKPGLWAEDQAEIDCLI